MLNLAKIAILAATVTLALAGSASAAPKPSHHQAWLDSLKAKSASTDTTSVGEAFVPNVEVVDEKAGCIAVGGQPKNQILGDGSVGFRCVPAYIFEQ